MFIGNGHGASILVKLLHKRLTSDKGDCCCRFELVTLDGGFVTYYPDRTLAIGGESRHFSPSPEHSNEIVYNSRMSRVKATLNSFLAQEHLDCRVIIGDYKRDTLSGLYQVMKPDN